jgi:hypothetical protein
MSPKGRFAAYAAAIAVLLAVFALYTQPRMMVRLSDLIWACFGR